ncbi:MAG: hypothetical protein PHF86_01650 [Candidatus Nanoarchaeia archaeon]|nr:hypothetical protein [Candidatus Nanoarchaeia archaeon]
MKRNKDGFYTKLRYTIIIGYVDYLDAVHSLSFYYGDGNNDSFDKTHEELFGKVLKGWRWDYDKGLNWSNSAGITSGEDYELIVNHLTQNYRIPFYENGYHDVQYFCKMMDEEEKG